MQTLKEKMDSDIDAFIALLQAAKQEPSHQKKAWTMQEVANRMQESAGYWDDKLQNY